MKKIIAACVDRVIEFDTSEEAAEYIEKLRGKKVEFRIADRKETEEGKCRIRVQEQYNKCPLIQ